MSLLKKLFPKIYDPELFHSKLNKRKFFENWEFKLISDDGKNILIIIPVLILGQNKLCYVEIVDGITGESYLINYPISHYKPSKGKMECYYSTSRFGKDGIDLSMSGLDFKIKGAIKFGAFTKYPSSVLSPGLMSYYSFVPFMESYFNLISRHHLIN